MPFILEVLFRRRIISHSNGLLMLICLHQLLSEKASLGDIDHLLVLYPFELILLKDKRHASLEGHYAPKQYLDVQLSQDLSLKLTKHPRFLPFPFTIEKLKYLVRIQGKVFEEIKFYFRTLRGLF